MPLTKNKRDKLKKDAEKLWATSPAKALRLLAKIAKIRKKIPLFEQTMEIE